MEEYLEFAKDIAFQAGKIMLKYFNESNGASYKGDKTIVTLADTEINSYLIKRVKEKYPNHAVDGEEEVYGNSDYVWVCDPVDGTAMYARHIPVAVFSVALVIDGVPNVGVVYDPFTNNLYTAIKGKGAYKNNEKISVNDYKLDDIRSLCHCGLWPNASYDFSKFLVKFSQKVRFNDIGSITRTGCLVATGDYNASIFIGTDHKNCDIAAVKVIVEEAGGKVTDLFGNEQRYDRSIKGALISNGIVHDEIVKMIKENIIER
ncbi:MAG: inositol monophosphatase [Clostridia bacterium]|nr:inositol monophosphatase [Clostridia bacterium]